MLLLIFFQLSLAKLSTPQGFISPVLLESNSLNRDESLIPDSINDSGPDYNKGDTYFVLVTTFIEDQPGSGKLWVVPTDLKMREYSYELIIGLNRPTGVCFDKNHRFLYIVDNGFVGKGFIYQYEIDWKTDELFVLARNVYVVVYEGVNPYDCKVDEYGNLYFLEAEYDTINMISYLDLYSGFTNMNYTIYQSDPYVSYPVALEIINSKDIYYANNYNGDQVGSINRADAKTKYVNGGKVNILVKNNFKTWGLTFGTSEYVYFSLETGEVWSVKNNDPSLLEIKSNKTFNKPKGLAYGSGFVYLAEFDIGNICKFNDTNAKETPELFIGLEGAYSVFCVNYGQILVVVLIEYLV